MDQNAEETRSRSRSPPAWGDSAAHLFWPWAGARSSMAFLQELQLAANAGKKQRQQEVANTLAS